MELAMVEKALLKPQIHLKNNHLRKLLPKKSQIKIKKELKFRQPDKPPYDPKFKQNIPPPPQTSLLPKPHSKTKPSENNRNLNTDSSPCAYSNNMVGDVLKLMNLLRLPLDEELYLELIKECTDTRDAIQGGMVHAHIMNSHKQNPSLGIMNRLMLMYASCGEIKSARRLFDEMPLRDTVSWATIIAAYSEYSNGHYLALKLFVQMHFEPREGQYYSHAIIVALRSCTRTGNLSLGLQIHSIMLKKLGLKNFVSGNRGSSLVQFYCSFGLHDTALQLFEKMKTYFLATIETSAWSTLITVCNQQGRFQEAICLFIEMVKSGKKRNTHSLSIVLTACAKIDDKWFVGKQIHADAIKNGFVSDRFVASSLVSMYAKNGLVKDAVKCFQGIEFPDLVCWNSILVSYARNGYIDKAVRVLYEMKLKGIGPLEYMIEEVKMSV